MEKAILKKVISGFKTDDVVTINYCAKLTQLSGDYTVLGVKKGRGKGGSMMAELKSLTGDKLVLVTKDSDQVLNVVMNGTRYGYETEAEVPPVYEKNALLALDFKRKFRSFEKAGVNNPINVLIKSEKVPELNGTHEIINYKQLRGRQGQVVLTTKTGLEIWSYRHSGVIDTFEIVG